MEFGDNSWTGEKVQWELVKTGETFRKDGGISAIGQQKLNTLSLYPNPAKDQLFVSGLSTVSDIIITDLTGKQLKKVSSANINNSDLTAGIYLVQIKHQKTLKFVKQ